MLLLCTKKQELKETQLAYQQAKTIGKPNTYCNF